MIVSGDPIRRAKLWRHGLVERIVSRDSFDGVLQFAARSRRSAAPHPRLRDMTAALPAERRRRGLLRRSARRSRQAGARTCRPRSMRRRGRGRRDAAVRRRPGARARASSSSWCSRRSRKALRHAFFAERAAAKIPDVPEDTPTRPIRKAAVLGFGTMGGGIAMSFANAGIPVTVYEKDRLRSTAASPRCRAQLGGDREEGPHDRGAGCSSAWRC